MATRVQARWRRDRAADRFGRSSTSSTDGGRRRRWRRQAKARSLRPRTRPTSTATTLCSTNTWARAATPEPNRPVAALSALHKLGELASMTRLRELHRGLAAFLDRYAAPRAVPHG